MLATIYPENGAAPFRLDVTACEAWGLPTRGGWSYEWDWLEDWEAPTLVPFHGGRWLLLGKGWKDNVPRGRKPGLDAAWLTHAEAEALFLDAGGTLAPPDPAVWGDIAPAFLAPRLSGDAPPQLDPAEPPPWRHVLPPRKPVMAVQPDGPRMRVRFEGREWYVLEEVCSWSGEGSDRTIVRHEDGRWLLLERESSGEAHDAVAGNVTRATFVPDADVPALFEEVDKPSPASLDPPAPTPTDAERAENAALTQFAREVRRAVNATLWPCEPYAVDAERHVPAVVAKHAAAADRLVRAELAVPFLAAGGAADAVPALARRGLTLYGRTLADRVCGFVRIDGGPGDVARAFDAVLAESGVRDTIAADLAARGPDGLVAAWEERDAEQQVEAERRRREDREFRDLAADLKARTRRPAPDPPPPTHLTIRPGNGAERFSVPLAKLPAPPVALADWRKDCGRPLPADRPAGFLWRGRRLLKWAGGFVLLVAQRDPTGDATARPGEMLGEWLTEDEAVRLAEREPRDRSAGPPRPARFVASDGSDEADDDFLARPPRELDPGQPPPPRHRHAPEPPFEAAGSNGAAVRLNVTDWERWLLKAGGNPADGEYERTLHRVPAGDPAGRETEPFWRLVERWGCDDLLACGVPVDNTRGTSFTDLTPAGAVRELIAAGHPPPAELAGVEPAPAGRGFGTEGWETADTPTGPVTLHTGPDGWERWPLPNVPPRTDELHRPIGGTIERTFYKDPDPPGGGGPAWWRAERETPEGPDGPTDALTAIPTAPADVAAELRVAGMPVPPELADLAPPPEPARSGTRDGPAAFIAYAPGDVPVRFEPAGLESWRVRDAGPPHPREDRNPPDWWTLYRLADGGGWRVVAMMWTRPVGTDPPSPPDRYIGEVDAAGAAWLLTYAGHDLPADLAAVPPAAPTELVGAEWAAKVAAASRPRPTPDGTPAETPKTDGPADTPDAEREMTATAAELEAVTMPQAAGRVIPPELLPSAPAPRSADAHASGSTWPPGGKWHFRHGEEAAFAGVRFNVTKGAQFRILNALAGHPRQTLPRETVCELASGDRNDPSDWGNVKGYVSRLNATLRRAFGLPADAKPLQNRGKDAEAVTLLNEGLLVPPESSESRD